MALPDHPRHARSGGGGVKRAREHRSEKRVTYVQNSILSRGISLAELRDLVAATADYSESSDVELDKKKITVTEYIGYGWRKVGR